MSFRISPRRVLAGLVPAVLAFGATAVAGQSTAAERERSLYERLGGLEPISIVVHDFMVRFAQDPLVMANPAVRERKTQERLPYLTYQVVTLVCEVTGGPCSYTGAGLAEAHEGLGVTEREWERMGMVFVETLNRHGIPEPEREELLAILGSAKDDIVVGGT